MLKTIRNILLFVSILISGCGTAGQSEGVRPGLDSVTGYQKLFSGKRVGIVTNHTAYDRNGIHIIDVFRQLPDVRVTALFGPEHGIRGGEAAGEKIESSTDPDTNIPIYSLYGKIRKPTAEMLTDVDVLVFDIQDVGARFYTYVYTMALAMEAAAENNIPFIVLDRPNPINGVSVEGNILEPEFATFVGLYPIPVRHGMTVGELAKLFNGEGWLENAVRADLTVIPMQGWKREMWYDQTGLTWRAPSPNMPDLNVATVYPGTCLFEGTNFSEGRGTYQPFLRFGSPWLNEQELNLVNKVVDLPGVHLGPIRYMPKSLPGMAPSPRFMNEDITGITLNVTDRNVFTPYFAGIALVKYAYDSNPEKFEWRVRHFDRLAGTAKIREFIINRKPLPEIKSWLDAQVQPFLPIREKYLIY